MAGRRVTGGRGLGRRRGHEPPVSQAGKYSEGFACHLFSQRDLDVTLCFSPLQKVEPPSAEFQVHPRVESHGLETSRHQVQPTADGLKAVT